MKVSQLINELIKLKKQHGDIEVRAGDPDYSGGDLYEVTAAVYHDGFHHYNANHLMCGYNGYGKAHIDLYHHLGSYCRECGRGCD